MSDIIPLGLIRQSGNVFGVPVRIGSNDAFSLELETNNTLALTIDSSQRVGIGAAPATTALLDLTSTTKGFLAPRLTTVERDTIVAPATGLLVYNTTTSLFNYYDGAAWIAVDSGTSDVTSVSGTAGRITSTGGTTPVIDIDAAYVGQASITTLGTITTGTWTGTAIAAANGGTGQTSYAVGDLLYASGATTLSKLADVATGNALISGGVGVAPSWGKIGLTTHIDGILPVANGGSGTSTAFTTGSVIFAGASGVYSQDNTNFFWNDTTNRLGLRTATPGSILEIKDDGTNPSMLSLSNSTWGQESRLYYSNNAGQLSWEHGGAIFMDVYANRRVEIHNTTSTAFALSVAGADTLNTSYVLKLANSAQTRVQVSNAGRLGIGQLTSDPAATIDLEQIVETSGSPTALRVVGGAHTTLTASAESIGARFNFSATKQFATGALATQREVLIQAPTYGFVAASTITDAATLAISGAPIAGTNATITNAYSLWVQGGKVKMDGTLVVGTPQTYTISNVTTDRSYDANSTTVDELADTLGTLINDLRTIGLIL